MRLHLAALVFVLAACGGDASSNADASVADDAAADASVDLCCPVQFSPPTRCGCLKIGGKTPSNGMCPERCNVNQADIPAPVTEDGCFILNIPPNSVCE